MKEISQATAAKALGVGSRQRQAGCINKIMAAYDYAPAQRVPVGRGLKYTYWDAQVKDAAKRESAKSAAAALEARAEKFFSPAPVKAPTQETLQLQDDDIIAIKKAIEGNSSYLCRLGERSERTERAIAQIESTQRLVVIALNRLLKAASLRMVPEVGANGSTHAAPEAQQ